MYNNFQMHAYPGIGESRNPNTQPQMPQHQLYRYHPQNQNRFNAMPPGGNKRQRDSPTSDGDNSWESSFKRLRMMDDTASDTYSTNTNYSSTKSSPEYDDNPRISRDEDFQAGLESITENFGSTQYTQQPIHRQVTIDTAEQSAGQRSMEISNGYQSMNTLLGNLHMLRQQRNSRPTPQPAAQVAQQMIPTPLAIPTRTHPASKKVSLRISSNLY